MAYDYKPGEDEGILRRYALIVGVVLVLATLIVLMVSAGLIAAGPLDIDSRLVAVVHELIKL